jgi:glycosyltransferase involved in cell wall biosynthesis
MRILFFSRWFPYPADNGARIRIFNLLRGLAPHHEITLVSFSEQPVSEEQLAALRPLCRAVYPVPYTPFRPTRARALLGYLSPRPRSVIDTYSPAIERLVAHELRDERFDLAIASEIDMAPYALLVPGAARLLEELEVATIYDQFISQASPQARLRGGLTWWKLARYLRSLLSQFDGCTVVSARERGLIERIAPPGLPLHIVPNGVDMAACSHDWGAPTPNSLIYAGALSYGPNFDAVGYLLREIMPLVQAEIPQAQLSITGSTKGVPLERLPASPGLNFTGYLPDVRPSVARSWLSVVPLRQGGGTRLKILESLALGTPVIATSKGAEGLDLRHGHEIIIADKPEEFAAAVLGLLHDPQRRAELSRAGRQAVAARYDWPIINQNLETFIGSIVDSTHADAKQRIAAPPV